MTTYPEEIARNISFVVADPRPPPLAFKIVAFAKEDKLIARTEGQFIGILRFVIVDCRDATSVQDSQLFLYA